MMGGRILSEKTRKVDHMTFEAILQIITSPKLRKILDDETRTAYQRAADIHAAFAEADALDAPRKARTIKARPEFATEATSATEGGGE
jgi:hypothetical protein